MALSEFVALEAAYRALQPLDKVARRRALRWLKDVLAIPEPLPESGPGSATEDAPTPWPVLVTESVENEKGSVAESERATTESVPEAEEEAVSAPVAKPAKPAKAAARATATRGTRKRTTSSGGGRGGSRGRGGKSAAKTEEKERVYRRMPAVNVVLAAYKEVGTVSGLAGHFGVPRHTVQGWARRLRASGYEIGRKSETEAESSGQ